MIYNTVKTVRVCSIELRHSFFNLLSSGSWRIHYTVVQMRVQAPSLPAPSWRVTFPGGSGRQHFSPCPQLLVAKVKFLPSTVAEVSSTKTPPPGWRPHCERRASERTGTLSLVSQLKEGFPHCERATEKTWGYFPPTPLFLQLPKWGCQREVGHCPHSQFQSAGSVIMLRESREPGKRNLGVAGLGKNKYPTLQESKKPEYFCFRLWSNLP